MCIIIYKPTGKMMVDETIIETCFANNPDGAGYMIREFNDSIKIRKGFMDVESFKNSLNRERNLENKEVVLHFRIATHGSVKKGNCHPFPITRSIADLRRVSHNKLNYAIAHNGIIQGYSSKNKYNLSDTMQLSKKLVAMIHQPLEMKKYLSGIHSRFIVFLPKETIITGEWIEEDGIKYSNASYMPYAYGMHRSNTYYETDIIDECDLCHKATSPDDLIFDRTTGLFICEDCIDQISTYQTFKDWW
jgi:hypothetical protein